MRIKTATKYFLQWKNNSDINVTRKTTTIKQKATKNKNKAKIQNNKRN